MRGRVAVVGAGLAGLAAALELRAAGAETTVLEARDRVGGRVWSTRLEGGEVAELGAEWIEEDQTAIRDLARALGVRLAPAGVDYRRREARGSAPATAAEQDAALAVARAGWAALSERDRSVATLATFLEALELTPAQRRTLGARLRGTYAQDPDRVALGPDGEGAFAAGTGRYLRAADGNQAIADAAAARLPDVRLGHAVEALDVDGDAVELRGRRPGGSGFTVRAEAAVIAVPAPAAARLTFDPPLPAGTAAAMRELPMGVASKLAVGTAEPPGPRAVQDVDVPFWSWAALGGDGAPRRVITAFAGSPAAQRILATGSGDPGPWLERLRAMHPDLSLRGRAVMVAWALDPLAGNGCYAAFDARSAARAPLLRERLGRLAFAGEHTGEHDTGTMDAAVASGRRAAAQIAGALGG